MIVNRAVIIKHNIDDLELGMYMFNLWVTDYSGNSRGSSIQVTVVESLDTKPSTPEGADQPSSISITMSVSVGSIIGLMIVYPAISRMKRSQNTN